MNKKVIAVIIAMLVVGVGGLFLMSNRSANNSSTETNGNNSSSNENLEEDNNTTDEVDDKIEVEEGGDKVLVLYFSESGNTEKVANFIHEEVGGDIIKLETVKTYPSSYNELVDYAQNEQRQNGRPELKTVIDNIDAYDTIFIGYPNWWGDMPMPIYTFLDTYDLSGKTIAPFITHGGSGLSGTPSKIQNAEANATVTEGLAVSGASAGSSKNAVTDWLTRIGF